MQLCTSAAAARRGRPTLQGAATQTGLPHGYHSGQRVLLVGEGNLSFALALSTLFDGEGANILATSLDRPGVARAAYPDLRDIEQSLEASGAAVRFGVDGAVDSAAQLMAAPRRRVSSREPHKIK